MRDPHPVDEARDVDGPADRMVDAGDTEPDLRLVDEAGGADRDSGGERRPGEPGRASRPVESREDGAIDLS